MSRVEAARAARHSVLVTPLDHVCLSRVHGDDARRALGHLTATTLRARDGQVQHVLMLRDDATVLADAFVLCDDESFELLLEGLTAAEFIAHASAHLPAGLDVRFEDRSPTHAVVGIDGPFAWELTSRVVGVEAVGLPYLTFFHSAVGCCYRAGKTGEYGYGLIVPRAEATALEARLFDVGADLDVVRGDVEVLDDAALENFFFCIRREGAAALSPLELQLQWRVRAQGDEVGSAALRARRAAGIAARVTTLVSEGEVRVGDTVRGDGQVLGRLLAVVHSASRGEWVALALLDVAYAVPGLSGLRVGDDARRVDARTVAPPVLNNQSMFVSAQMHSYATRREITLPPLARP